MKCNTVMITVFVFMLALSYGCSDQGPAPVKTPAGPAVNNAAPPVEALKVEDVTEAPASQEGYVYEQRDRRDPFIPLILPRVTIEKKEVVETGTLQSYDISEFRLTAIARKGNKYFALLVTPDNRSFTVNEGDIIGLSKGRVEDISQDQITLVEYSKDYRGELKPRKIILEFAKGEAK